MRFQQDGIVLWYGTHDAPEPAAGLTAVPTERAAVSFGAPQSNPVAPAAVRFGQPAQLGSLTPAAAEGVPPSGPVGGQVSTFLGASVQPQAGVAQPLFPASA